MMSTLDKHMLKELLLVCSALGSVETSELDAEASPEQRFVRGESCLEWLQDLQRAIRRDDDNTREIAITISSWRVVQQKLVPLILECRDDRILVKTLVKIYVMLTTPLSKAAEEALAKAINPKDQGDVRDQQARRRENALAQQAARHAFKRAFISKDVLSVIVGMLEEPLSHTGVARTDEDKHSIELCLTLLRNVLNIQDPTPGLVTSLGDHYAQMHEQLVALFQDALLLDILLLLAQDVHARENAKLNLLLVDIFHCFIRDQEPGAVIAAHRSKVQREACKGPAGGPSPTRHAGSSLMSVLAKEKSKRELGAGRMHSRHTRFGGTLQVGGGNGLNARIVANPFKDRVDCVPQATRQKSKIGKTFTADGMSGDSQGSSQSNKSILAREALYEFCCSFLKTAYDPFMRSIKNEFRVDSARLDPEDKGKMFRLMYFFMSFHHQLHQAAVKDAAHAGRKGANLPKYELGHVIETMDLMSFNLVLREAETAMSAKVISESNAKRLAECVAVLKEMMHIVTILNESSEETHQVVAVGLLASIFYTSEPLDKLNEIVRNWKPGKFTKTFLCHLVELVHTTLKALEWYRNSKSSHPGGVDGSAGSRDNKGEQVNQDVLDRVADAKKFDFDHYFGQLATNNIVRMYTNLLEQYATNSVRTNHYILSFMMRLSTSRGGASSKKRRGKAAEMDRGQSNDGASLEPMLYNVHTLGVFQKILDDPCTSKSAFKNLVHYVLSVVRHFGTLAQKNRLVFVEALFQHPHPKPFCEALCNVYHDAEFGNTEDNEPRKKRTTRKLDMDEESDVDNSEIEDSEPPKGQTPAGPVGGGNDAGGGEDQADEEEWDEKSTEKAAEASGDEASTGEASGGEASGGEESDRRKGKKKKDKKARRRGGRSKTPEETLPRSGKKKRAPRWTKEEDAYLREQYPVYADSSSAFEVLGAADEMEAKHRTHEQIKARVKKLGLTAPSQASMGVDSESAADTDNEPGDKDADMADNAGGSDEAEKADDVGGSDLESTAGDTGPGPESPVHVRKLLSKNHGQSDDDDEGLFSSTEDNDDNAQTSGRGEASAPSPPTHRSNKRAILEDSSSDDE